jgi:hypothetical protein
MNRGPVTGAARNAAMDRSFAEKAAAAWPAPLPDWLAELAATLDAKGLRVTAKIIGYSASALSQAISDTYRGDIERVAEKVRGALMGFEVECPVLGAIGRHQCLDNQKLPFAVTNAVRTRLYHACRRGCPHSRIRE